METGAFIISILFAALRAGTPLLIVTLGEILAEKVGVLNLGLEGMMLMGALSGFVAAYVTSDPWVGMMAAMLVGGLMALLHAFVTVTLRANQVVSGLAITLLGTGLSAFLGPKWVGKLGPEFASINIPIVSDIPYIGPILFRHDPPVYIGLLLVPIIWIWLNKTRPGLHMRLVGENPASADTAGINVDMQRYIYVVIGGMLAGLAGAVLSLSYTPGWKDWMTAGRGWIGIGLVIFAMWNPMRAAFGAFLFGAVSALQFGAQIQGIRVSIFFLQMMPYLFTLVALASVSHDAVRKQIAMPSALSIPYKRGERG
jgi:general nucleoside transport system permease protein